MIVATAQTVQHFTCDNCGDGSAWTPSVVIALLALVISGLVAWSQWRDKQRRARFVLDIEAVYGGGSSNSATFRAQVLIANHGDVPAENVALNVNVPRRDAGQLKWKDMPSTPVHDAGEQGVLIERIIDRVGIGGRPVRAEFTFTAIREGPDEEYRDVELGMQTWADALDYPSGIGAKRTFRVLWQPLDGNQAPDFVTATTIEPLGDAKQYKLPKA